MQSKIILIGVTSLDFAFFGAFLILFQIKYCLFQQGVLEGRCKLPQWGPGRSPGSQSIFWFYIASNPSKAVKNIIWLINL